MLIVVAQDTARDTFAGSEQNAVRERVAALDAVHQPRARRDNNMPGAHRDAVRRGASMGRTETPARDTPRRQPEAIRDAGCALGRKPHAALAVGHAVAEMSTGVARLCLDAGPGRADPEK